MQTFIPCRNYSDSARVLDNKRLGKQRVECYQIARTLVGETNGWARHPAVQMWKGYEYELLLYARIICIEWKERGFKDSISQKLRDLEGQYPERFYSKAPDYPAWMIGTPFCSSHRAALLYKDFPHYSQFGWTEEPSLNYWWPTKHLNAWSQRNASS